MPLPCIFNKSGTLPKKSMYTENGLCIQFKRDRCLTNCLMFYSVQQFNTITCTAFSLAPSPSSYPLLKYNNLSEGGTKALLHPFSFLFDSRWHKFWTKTAYVVWEQRRRSASASAQSEQRLLFTLVKRCTTEILRSVDSVRRFRVDIIVFVVHELWRLAKMDIFWLLMMKID